MGTYDEPGLEVLAVYVNGTVSDFSFQILVDGEAAFSATQSPTSTDMERFVPDAPGRFEVSSGATTIEFSVTSASATGGSTADVDVEAVVTNNI